MTGIARLREGNDMRYTLIKDVRDHSAAREAFDRLAGEVFDLSFAQWYRDGYWGDRYIPYLLMDGDTAVANVSVNVMDIQWDGQTRRYVQLGTVMTAPAYRGQGCAAYLMEQVLQDWEGRCEAVYLFANATVLDFYPRFGFRRETEHQSMLPVSPHPAAVRRLDMEDAADRALLLAAYQKGNPFSRIASVGNDGLLMFYCSSFLKDRVYYLKDYKAVAIMEDDSTCLEIFGDVCAPLEEVLAGLVPQKQTVALGFTPHMDKGYKVQAVQGDDFLFTRAREGRPLLEGGSGMFPLLSHA